VISTIRTLNDDSSSPQPLDNSSQPHVLHSQLKVTAGRPLTTRDNDDQQQHDYAHDDPDPHLHILPPHLLADTIGATTEALRGLVEILGLVLELVDMFAALGDGFEILFHDIDGVVDLL